MKLRWGVCVHMLATERAWQGFSYLETCARKLDEIVVDCPTIMSPLTSGPTVLRSR